MRPVRGCAGPLVRGRFRLLVVLTPLAAIIPAALGLAASSYAVPGRVNVFPIPGARAAMPQTQITFRGVPISQLGTVTVTGSSTGVHAGVLKPDSDGRGGSFIPAQPFAPNETVTVQASGVSIVGGSGSTYRFTVANVAGVIPLGHRPRTPRVRGDVQRFHSMPGLIPPAVKQTNHGRPDRGDIFLAPLAGPVQSGPMIIDSRGRLIWFDKLPPGGQATDLRAQTYDGRPVVTWWQGNVNKAGIGQGVGVIEDSSYRPVAIVHAGNGFNADLHEFQLTPQNTALITAYRPVFWNATGLKGGTSHTLVMDATVQEIDIPTGLVLFQWDSLDHIPLADTYHTVPKNHGHPFDYFHLNSVEPDYDGNLIISSRDTWSGYKINHQTGQVMWTLGGKRSNFKMGKGASFAYQHDVRAHDHDSTITVFDDGGGPPRIHFQSRGLTLHLNFKKKTASVVVQDFHHPPIVSSFEGNDQLLPGNHSMVGWGQVSYWTEFDARGRTVTDGRFVGPNANYRAWKFPWTGRPAQPPAVAASGGRRKATVWASWNGSTTVRKWRILGGRNPTKLHSVRVVRIRGFETAIHIHGERYVEAQALDGKGHLLASSSTVRVR
jgi:hypothetical protein